MNFNGSVLDEGWRGGANLVIRGPDSRLLAARGSQIFDISVPEIELRAIWEGIGYPRLVLRAESILLEGDSMIVVK